MRWQDSYLLIRKYCPIDRVKVHEGFCLICETMVMQQEEDSLRVLVETGFTSHKLLSGYKSLLVLCTVG